MNLNIKLLLKNASVSHPANYKHNYIPVKRNNGWNSQLGWFNILKSINSEKVFEIIQHPFMVKTLRKLGMEGNFLKLLKRISKTQQWPRLVWLNWLDVDPQSERLPVQFLLRAHAWVAGLILSVGTFRRQPPDVSLSHQCFSPSLSPSLPPSLEMNINSELHSSLS